MKPYYSRGDIVLYHGDCREILPTLGPVDLLLTDPPYGRKYSHGKSTSRKWDSRHHGIVIQGDDKPFDPSPFLDFPKVILWGANHFASRLPDSAGWLVWNKRPEMEPCDFSDGELAWTNFLNTARFFTHRWMGVLRASQSGDKSQHPNEKPVALMQWCIELAPDCRAVVDPFAGSGTTGVACIRLGRKYIGIELEEKYCEISAHRFDAELDKGRLFDAAELEQPKQLESCEVTMK